MGEEGRGGPGAGQRGGDGRLGNAGGGSRSGGGECADAQDRVPGAGAGDSDQTARRRMAPNRMAHWVTVGSSASPCGLDSEEEEYDDEEEEEGWSGDGHCWV